MPPRSTVFYTAAMPGQHRPTLRSLALPPSRPDEGPPHCTCASQASVRLQLGVQDTHLKTQVPGQLTFPGTQPSVTHNRAINEQMHLRCACKVTQQAAILFLCPLRNLDLVTKSTTLKGFIHIVYWPCPPLCAERPGFKSKATPRMCHLQHVMSWESAHSS